MQSFKSAMNHVKLFEGGRLGNMELNDLSEDNIKFRKLNPSPSPEMLEFP